MRKMPMCPMMMGQMPMMMGQMPMMGQMHMMQPMDMCMEEYQKEEMDEEYFAGMHSEACRMMMPYVMRMVDKMEKKGDMIYQEYPEREMVESMSNEAYDNMVKDMPEMADEYQEERQFGGRRRFGRDLISILLLNELLRRRRRRRRRHDYDNGYPGYGYDDYYYND